MANIQLRLDGDVNETWDVGGRFTWYNLFDLTPNFLALGVDSRGNPTASTFAAGNIPGGLTGNPFGGSMNVVEAAAYTTANLIERWPITLLFDFSQNLSASSSFITYTATAPPLTFIPFPGTYTTGPEGTAWMAAMSIGDTKEILRFRMLYAWLEANAFPAQFVDSDLFDQFTNRRGWVWDFSKHVFTNTEASLTLFYSDPIKTNLAYQNSLYGSRRFRMQANLVWSF